MDIQSESLSCEIDAIPQLDRPALKKLFCSASLCFIFMIGEIVGGILAGSLAIGTDAAHLLADLISFFISILAVYLAARQPSARLNFGWHRAEAVGALFSVAFIWIVTVVLVGLAVLRMMSGQYEIDSEIMLITSAAGVILNLIMMIVLHGGKRHLRDAGPRRNHRSMNISETSPLLSGSESNCLPRGLQQDGGIHREMSAGQLDTVSLLGRNVTPDVHEVPGAGDKPSTVPPAVVPVTTNINVRAAFIHVLGDLIQSIGVVVAAIIIYFKPDYKMADPICTFVFSFLVLCTTLQILKHTILILMEACPKHVDHREIKDCLSAIARVKSVHNLRVWTLKDSRPVASVHLVLEKREEGSRPSNQDVLLTAQRMFKEMFFIEDCTVQLEECKNTREQDQLPDGSLFEA